MEAPCCGGPLIVEAPAGRLPTLPTSKSVPGHHGILKWCLGLPSCTSPSWEFTERVKDCFHALHRGHSVAVLRRARWSKLNTPSLPPSQSFLSMYVNLCGVNDWPFGLYRLCTEARCCLANASLRQ